jgi:acyl-CoA hydrolase
MFIGSNAAVPHALMRDLIASENNLADIELVHILTLQNPIWAQPEYRALFKINSLFLGAGVRDEVAAGYADYTPCFLSEIPSLFEDKILALDVALIMVSPADDLGYCSLGVSVDIVRSAAKAAKIVVAQINPQMPVTQGQAFMHIDEIDFSVQISEPICELSPPKLDPITEQMGQYASLLIDDGDTLKLGIGKIPDAVLYYLKDHIDLGIHTEMFSDSLIDLVKSGVINNRKKSVNQGKVINIFCILNNRLYYFIDNDSYIEFHPSEYVNSPVNIARNDNMVSINSAIEVDLTGQVVSDSIGYQFYSGISGQVDFIRGASMSKGGKPIIALASTAKNGTVSKITAFITEGSGVVTSRGDVHYVVTEYGIASLRGKSIRERALELIKIVHPKFRGELLSQVRQHMRVPHYPLQSPRPIPELGKVSVKKLYLAKQDFVLRPLAPSDERHLQEFFILTKKKPY